MGAEPPEPDPRQRLSALLQEKKGLLLERWERRILAAPLLPAPLLGVHLSALVDRIAARLRWEDGEPPGSAPDAAAPWERALDDLHGMLGALSHLRAAILDLCAAEGVPLEGEPARIVHAAIDEAMMAVAAAIARAARAPGEQCDRILRLLPVGVFVADAQGRLLTINDAAARIWGQPAPLVESMEHYHLYRAYRPGASEPLAAEEWGLACALRGGAPVEEDLEIVCFDGERRTIVNTALALRDADGTVTGGVAVNVDVTDRKRTEQRLAAILEGALDAIVLIDASGRVTEFNPAAARMFGYTRAEAMGRELAELVIEPALREAHRRGLQRYLATGETRHLDRRVELRAMRADGTLFDTELTVIRLPAAAGSAALFAGFIRDITDRKRAEQERVREAEFRERFIGMLGHDLRTPLGAVSFTARALLGGKDLGDAATRALRRIVCSADRMDRMIGDLLDFARSRQRGGFPVKPGAVELSALCRQVIEEIKLSHPDRAVDFHARREVRGLWDPDRLAQVVQNLVVNALDHSPADTRAEVTLDGAADPIVLTVKNAGPPIPPEVLLHLFDPFQRGARAPAPRHAPRGLGLGLYIAHEIVRAHHGRIDVESDPTRGTTFTVQLPRALSAA